MINFLKNKIEERVKNNSLRELKTMLSTQIDFSSNDYLGFSRSIRIKEKLKLHLQENQNQYLGATGSRLITGHTLYIENLENKIAEFHDAACGLIFNSGYDANLGLLSAIAQRGDTIICDEFIHASLIDGARLSYANRYVFKHNNLKSLEEKLKNSKGNIFIVTESVFSMDGDAAPLTEICSLALKYNANVIVDEAHAIGVVGQKGKGLVQELNLENQVFARINTFGKALGCHGAIILGSKDLKTYLINFARSFIYTTALPFHSLANINIAYSELSNTNHYSDLKIKICFFLEQTISIKYRFLKSDSAIQCFIIPGNDNCKAAAQFLQAKGFDIRAILNPTVAEGKERLRICLHTYNSFEEIKALVEILKTLS